MSRLYSDRSKLHHLIDILLSLSKIRNLGKIRGLLPAQRTRAMDLPLCQLSGIFIIPVIILFFDDPLFSADRLSANITKIAARMQNASLSFLKEPAHNSERAARRKKYVFAGISSNGAANRT